MLKIDGVNKIFYKGTPDERRVLSDFRLFLDAGEFVTVIGGNGAGKSTLFNVIAGSLLPDGGEILLDGQDITYMSEHKRAALIGRMFQDPLKGTAPHMTVEENLAISYMRSTNKNLMTGISKKDSAMLKEKLAQLNLGLEERMKSKMGSLSGGQRQAVTLVMATLVRPKLLLLDEHTAALDPISAQRVLEMTQDIIEKHGITTMMITHSISAALKLGSRTIMLDHGKTVIDIEGEQRKNLTTEGLLERFAREQKKNFDCDSTLL